MPDVVSFCLDRTSAVTRCPAASACSTSGMPVAPVAPRTLTFIGLLPPRSAGGARERLTIGSFPPLILRLMLPRRFSRHIAGRSDRFTMRQAAGQAKQDAPPTRSVLGRRPGVTDA